MEMTKKEVGVGQWTEGSDLEKMDRRKESVNELESISNLNPLNPRLDFSDNDSRIG